MTNGSALKLMWLLTTPMSAAVPPGDHWSVPPMTPLAASGFVSQAAYPLNRLDRIAGLPTTEHRQDAIPSPRPPASSLRIVERRQAEPPPLESVPPLTAAAVLTEGNPETRRERRSRRRQPRWAGRPDQ